MNLKHKVNVELENRRAFTRTVGSNPTLSANVYAGFARFAKVCIQGEIGETSNIELENLFYFPNRKSSNLRAASFCIFGKTCE